MRKLIKIAASAVGLFSLFLAGCSDIDSDDSATVSGGANSASSTKSITVNVTSNSDLVDFSAKTSDGVRTLTPDALDADSLKFYIGGTNLQTGIDIEVQEVIFKGKETTSGGTTTTSKKEGSVTIDLDPSNYKLTLVAYLSSDTQPSTGSGSKIANAVNGAVLIAYATADLRRSDTVTFYLTSDGLSGTGSIDLNLYLKNWSERSLAAVTANDASDKTIASATIGLTNMNTGITIVDFVAINFTGKTTDSTCANFKPTGSVSPGMYNIDVKFTAYSKTFTYSDTILILSNQTTTGTIAIPDVLENPPDKPANFKVGYVVPTSNDNSSGYYKAVFNWEDKSSNENYFQIQLYKVPESSETPESCTEAKWPTSDTGVTTYDTEFFGSETDWYAGSLQKNNTWAVFYLPLGERYLARIRAVNELSAPKTSAKDEWVYADMCDSIATVDEEYTKVSDSGITKESASSSTISLKGHEFSRDVINLYRLSYYPNGGTFSPSGLTEIYYFDQTASGNEVMTPNGEYEHSLYNTSGDKKITLKNGESIWANWRIDSSSGITYPNEYKDGGAKAQSGKTYYTKSSADSNPKDVNGSKDVYIAVSPQPDVDDDIANFYYDSGNPTAYKGYKNLNLYANYTSTAFDVKIRNKADYTIPKNLDITASVGTGGGSLDATQAKIISRTSSGVTTSNYLEIKRTQTSVDNTDPDNPVTVTNRISKVNFDCTKSSDAVIDYDYIELVLSKLGGANESTLTANTGGTFTIEVNTLEEGKYTATFRAYTATNPTAPYTYPIVLDIQD